MRDRDGNPTTSTTIRGSANIEHLKPYWWKPGQSGNPKGKPKGSRDRFSKRLVEDFAADWAEHGADAIRRVREKRPHEYLKVAVALIPKQFELNADPIQDMSDGELDKRIRQLAGIIGIAATEPPAEPPGISGGTGGADGGEGGTDEAQRAGGLPALPKAD